MVTVVRNTSRRLSFETVKFFNFVVIWLWVQKLGNGHFSLATFTSISTEAKQILGKHHNFELGNTKFTTRVYYKHELYR